MNSNHQIIQIPIQNIEYNLNLIDFTNTYDLLKLSKQKQDYIDQTILQLRQQYFIDYYKKFLEYLSLKLSYIINQYFIMEVYSIDFDFNVHFESLQRYRFDPYYYPKRSVLQSKEEHIKQELTKGIMMFVKPDCITHISYNHSHNTVNNININNDLSILNFIRLIDKDNKFIIYPESINNSVINLSILLNVINDNDILTELAHSNCNEEYDKMFEYNYKIDKVLYITDKFKNDVDNIIYD